MAREGFVVYHEMLDFIAPYGDAERGRLLTAMLNYSMTGEEPELPGNERFIWPAIRGKIDRDNDAYEARCEKNRKNRQRWLTTVNDRQRSSTMDNDRQRSLPTETETETITGTETETITGTETETETKQKQKLTKEREGAHAHGEYGHVKLTDSQYGKLLADLGQEELERCIRYIDESAQGNGNKNKWKDWNLIVRKCHREGWGLDQRRKKQYTPAAEYKAPQSNIDPWSVVDQI